MAAQYGVRPRRDATLPETYRSWIDPGQPLPDDVRLLPRQIDVGQDLVIAAGLGVPFALMGSFMGAMLAMVLRSAETRSPDLLAMLLFTAVTTGLWLVPLALIRRLVTTIRALNDAKHGRLRQGLMLGPRGLLVRLAPNDCYLVPAEEFAAAKLRVPRRGRPQRFFRIETRGDAVEFFAERLEGEPDDVNRHEKRVWRGRL